MPLECRSIDCWHRMIVRTALARSKPCHIQLGSSALSNDNREGLDAPENASLVRAMGGALSIFAAMLARKGLIETGEVANILGMYAVTTSEVAQEEGMILGTWAAMLRDIAELQDKAPPA